MIENQLLEAVRQLSSYDFDSSATVRMYEQIRGHILNSSLIFNTQNLQEAILSIHVEISAAFDSNHELIDEFAEKFAVTIIRFVEALKGFDPDIALKKICEKQSISLF